MASVKDTTAKLTASLKRFSGPQVTLGIIGIVLIAIVAGLIYSNATKSQMAPLFSGISASDASAITEQLTAAGVDYELTSGGTTILVPEADVNAQRIAAAANGLPSDSSSGYSILDSLTSTSTEFQQTTSYKRAIEGELEGSVASIKGVTTASVQLALPEDTVFVAEKPPATASVFVKTRTGTTLSTDQVNAIVHLVSASVEGMSATNVAVIDSGGEVLSAVGQGTTGNSADASEKLQARTSASIQRMLDQMFGSGNSNVAVSTTISAESADVLTETFGIPEGSPVLNESTTTEQYGDGAGGATGVLGPDNIAVPAPAAGEGAYVNDTVERQNAIDKVTENRTVPAGAIQRQTISVAVNEDAIGGITVEEVVALVNGAAGVDEARGDAVNVEVVPFDTTAAEAAAAALEAAEAEEAAAAAAETTRQLMIAGGIALAVIAILAVLFFTRRRKVVATVPAEEYTPIVPVMDYTLPTTTEPEEEDPLAGIRFVAGDPSSAERIVAEVADASQRHPEKVAAQLREMMKKNGPAR